MYSDTIKANTDIFKGWLMGLNKWVLSHNQCGADVPIKCLLSRTIQHSRSSSLYNLFAGNLSFSDLAIHESVKKDGAKRKGKNGDPTTICCLKEKRSPAQEFDMKGYTIKKFKPHLSKYFFMISFHPAKLPSGTIGKNYLLLRFALPYFFLCWKSKYKYHRNLTLRGNGGGKERVLRN